MPQADNNAHENDPISIEDVLNNFTVKSYQADQLPMFMNDFDDVFRHLRQGMRLSADIGCDLEEMDMKDKIPRLESNLTDLIDLEHKINNQKIIFRDIQQRVNRNESVHDALHEYKTKWDHEINMFDTLPISKKYHTHEEYSTFKQLIWNVQHPDEPMPGVEGSQENDDDEIVVSRTKQSLKCPLTTSYYVEPVTSKLCKHTFSKKAIFNLLSRNHGQIECPMPGCAARLSTQILYDDRLIERKVAHELAKQSQQTTDNFYDVEE